MVGLEVPSSRYVNIGMLHSVMEGMGWFRGWLIPSQYN